MNKKRIIFSILSVLLTSSLLFGCGPDDNEPDPTEEPSEQQQQENEEIEEEKE